MIEHVPSVVNYLAEIRRVLKPGGTFICATPDRRGRLFPRQRPFNVYHLEEWAPHELEQLLAPVFSQTSVFGMTAPAEVVNIELDRCRRTRLMTYPFTFPGAPEPWRAWGLMLMKSGQHRVEMVVREGDRRLLHRINADATCLRQAWKAGRH